MWEALKSPNTLKLKVSEKRPRLVHITCVIEPRFLSHQGELKRRRGRQGFRTLCCDVFGLLKNKFLRNNNNKGSRSKVNKHELVYGESSSNARDAPDVCLSFVLLFTIFIIVVTQKQVLQQSKNVTAKCTVTLLPPPSIQFSLSPIGCLIIHREII